MRWFVLAAICLWVPGAPESHAASSLQQAESLSAAKNYDSARAQFLQVAWENSQTTTAALARFRAAECLFAMKKYPEVKYEIESIQKNFPPSDLYQRNGLEYYLARIPYEEGKSQPAAEALAQVARLHPTSVWGAKAGLLQGSALRQLKKYAEARQAFLGVAQAQRKPEFSLEARHRAAQCLFDMGDADGFDREQKALLAGRPPFSNKWVQMTAFLRCQLPVLRGNPHDAAVAIEDFMALNPNFYWADLAWHRCGKYYMEAANQSVRAGVPKRAAMYESRGRLWLGQLCGKLKKEAAADPAQAADYHTRFMIVENYFIARDYASTLAEARKLSAEFPKPTKLWAAGKIWEAIALAQNKANYSTASAVLDELLGADVKDNNIAGHLPTKAAYWRGFLARTQRDQAGFDLAVLRLVEQPEGPSKTAALKALKISN